MIYIIIGLIAGVGVMFARARNKRKKAGLSTDLMSVAYQASEDVQQRKIDRANKKAERKIARYQARHPRKIAKARAKSGE